MKTSKAGIDLIKRWEGLRLKAYTCAAGVWTIGWGHTAGVRKGQKITIGKAERYLAADVKQAERAVSRYNHAYGWTQHEFDALVSYEFNTGTVDKLVHLDGDASKRLRTKQEIADALMLYIKAAGVPNRGLMERRVAERSLFLSTKKRPTLKRGDKGGDVRELQVRLGGIAVDGDFGPATERAVKAWQRHFCMEATGVCDAKTWAAVIR